MRWITRCSAVAQHSRHLRRPCTPPSPFTDVRAPLSYPDLSTSSPSSTCIVSGYPGEDGGLFGGHGHQRGPPICPRSIINHHHVPNRSMTGWHIQPTVSASPASARLGLGILAPDSGSSDIGPGGPSLCASTPSLGGGVPSGASCVPEGISDVIRCLQPRRRKGIANEEVTALVRTSSFYFKLIYP